MAKTEKPPLKKRGSNGGARPGAAAAGARMKCFHS
jgi:hypothetical protein